MIAWSAWALLQALADDYNKAGASPCATEVNPADSDSLTSREAHMGLSMGSCEASAAARLVNEEQGKGLLSNGGAEVRGPPFARRVESEDRVGLVASRESSQWNSFLKRKAYRGHGHYPEVEKRSAPK